MTNREIIPTHSAFLELKAERAGMQEGYRFLDEKRLILAAEILGVLADYEATERAYGVAADAAGAALRTAIGRHGLDGLAVTPAGPPARCAGVSGSRSVLGVRIETPPEAGAGPGAGLGAGPAMGSTAGPNAGPDGGAPTPAALDPSPEAAACRVACHDLLPLATRLARLTGNLERLRVEYLRTARRARALEDVLLPEIDDTLRSVDTALEELEREEAVRVRRVRR